MKPTDLVDFFRVYKFLRRHYCVSAALKRAKTVVWGNQ